MMIDGIKLNDTERQVKKLVEQYINRNDLQAAKAAYAIYCAEKSQIRFTWQQLVMGRERV